MAVNTGYNANMVDGLTPSFVRRYEIDRAMLWSGENNGSSLYGTGAIVRHGNWIMRAESTTGESPDIVLNGDPYWVGYPTEPSWTIDTATTNRLCVGQLYYLNATFSSIGFINAVRVYIAQPDANLGYSLILSMEDGHTSVFSVKQPPVPGWVDVEIGEFAFIPSAYARATLSAASLFNSSVIYSSWNYQYTDNDRDPASGEMIQPRQPSMSQQVVKVSKTSAANVDESASLASLSVGDSFSWGGSWAWTIEYIIEYTDYYYFEVSPVRNHNTNGVNGSALYIKDQLAIDYVSVPNHFSSNPLIRGDFHDDSCNSSSGEFTDDNGYGIDIQIQEAKMPEDWSIVYHIQDSRKGWTYLKEPMVIYDAPGNYAGAAVYYAIGAPSTTTALLVQVIFENAPVDTKFLLGPNSSHISAAIVVQNGGLAVPMEGTFTVPSTQFSFYTRVDNMVDDLKIYVWGYHVD